MSDDTLSYCTPGMPGFESLVRDQAFREFATITNPTQCKTILRIQDSGKPSIPFIASGGVITEGVVIWDSGGADRSFSTLMTSMVVNGDVTKLETQFGPITALQGGYLEALFTQRMGEALWAVAPGADAPLGMVHFAAQNPLGILDVGGSPLVASDMGKLRDMVSPWAASSPMAYVMHSTTLRQLEDSAGSRVYQQGPR